MNLKFETGLLCGDRFVSFNDPTTPLIDLGTLTEEELGGIMDIAARKEYWVLVKPTSVGPEARTYG